MEHRFNAWCSRNYTDYYATGSVDLTSSLTLLDTTSGHDKTLSLATGNYRSNENYCYENKRWFKQCNYDNCGGIYVDGYPSIVWNSEGDAVTLMYNGTKWVVTSNFGATIS